MEGWPLTNPLNSAEVRESGPALGAPSSAARSDFAGLSLVLACVSLFIIVLSAPAASQQLSLRHYDVAEGLAASHVTCIFQDDKGYMWFGTWEGVSRFDGYQFVSYGLKDGLPHTLINSIVQDADGHIWVATNGGIARFEDQQTRPSADTAIRPGISPAPKFTSFSLGQSADLALDNNRLNNEVNDIFFDNQGNMWCGTDGGIFRSASSEPQAETDFELMAPMGRAPGKLGAMVFGDSYGRIWSNIGGGLVQIIDRRTIDYRLPVGFKNDDLIGMWEDQRHSLLAAFSSGIFEFIPSSDSPGSARWIEIYRVKEVLCAALDDQGSLWVGTPNGAIKFKDGTAFFYTTSQGLSDNVIVAISQDREGTIWIGTQSGGLCKLENESIASFTKTDLPDQNVANVIEDKEGRIYAATFDRGVVQITGGSVAQIPGSSAAPFGNLQHRIIQDRSGHWWIGTGAGVFRSRGPELQFVGSIKYGRSQGIREDAIYHSRGPSMYADLAGVIWISSENYLYRNDPSQGLPFQAIPLRLNGAPIEGVLCMMMDSAGVLWVATYSGLYRFASGQFLPVEASEGLPVSKVRALFIDSRGWLWLGLRYTGVALIRDPGRQPFEIINYSMATGLASDAVWTITEDDAGRIYLGTERGLDQLDVSTGQVRHFTTAEGLAGSQINKCMRDSHGNIWVAASGGLSRLDPRALRDSSGPPPVYLRRVQAAGEDLPLPETGTTDIPPIELAYSRNNILIEYVGLSFRGGPGPGYQYKLEGVDTDWSAPSLQRSINYARLAPGKYTFLVRTVDRTGQGISQPASFEFRILSPIWRRWWAISIAALLLAGAIYGTYRYRLNQLLQIERVRTRIATDLHDDIGANLSLIAMSSEVARRRAGHDPQLSEYLSSIASTSRDLVDSMSDIVWAVNPKKDRVGDLAHRMRGFASDILGTHEMRFRFLCESEQNTHRLPTDVRRELFLIFKEGLNNAVRHSQATEVDVEFAVNGKSLLLGIKDNGRGFDLGRLSDGNGLESMRGRAARLGGDLEVATCPGVGTSLKIRIPIP
jgi:ligand-binding sensor domain-containing protein/signal transduction histidine kinase